MELIEKVLEKFERFQKMSKEVEKMWKSPVREGVKGKIGLKRD